MPIKPAYTYQTASGIVSTVKTKVVKIIVTPDGTNASYVDVHDGVSASDPQVIRLRVPATQSVPFPFEDDLILERGLYLVFGTNLSSVTVLWEPEE